MAKICIVTPETIGPVTNGGIGTACYFLAWSLAQAGHDVHILYTGPFVVENEIHWKQWYGAKNITFDWLTVKLQDKCHIFATPWEVLSLNVYEQLKDSSFDQIHFQDWLANGFHCFQAKRTIGHFAHTRLTITLHSSTEWIDQGMEQWAPEPPPFARLKYCERYCAHHADTVISPSKHMLDWVRNAGWQLADDARHIPNILLNETGKPEYAQAYMPSPGVFAFFGRLETRKGLHLFCKALASLPEVSRTKIKRVFFIGKSWQCEGEMGVEYIHGKLQEFGMPFEIHTNLDSFQAQNLIRKYKALVFCPSLLENLPYSIVECAWHGIPVMGTDTSGIPEILSQQHLFSATVAGLRQSIEQILEHGYKPAMPVYDSCLAEKLWLELAAEKNLPQPKKSPTINPCPKISICIPHYNHGIYLPAALEALAMSDYSNFEVITTDDGSTDEFSKNVFSQLITETKDKRFRFYRKENEGLATCRNFCASKANGEFLVFMDSDNIPMPHMLSTFSSAINYGNLDALTCHFLAFPQGHIGTREPEQLLYRYSPPGPDLITGLVENVFGDANMIIRKEIFNAIEGFASTRETYEDWEFLARLSLAGYRQDVIPESLFWYRHANEGWSRTSSLYKARKLVLSAYNKHLDPLAMQAIEKLLVPLYIRKYPEAEEPSPTPPAVEAPDPTQPAFRVVRYNKLTRLLRHIAPDLIDAYLLEHSNAFDQTFYLQANRDVALQGINPALHYIKYGAKEGRDPSSWFSTHKYLCANPDVKKSGENPLMHFLISGFKEGRQYNG